MAEGRAVTARNFPAAWVAEKALSGLPAKVQSLLQRIGSLDGPPTVSKGEHGLEVIAIFANAASARDAVQTLHRFDLRSEAEKKAVNHQAPKENERFFVKIVEAPPAPAVAAPAPATTPAAPAAGSSASSAATPAAPQPPKTRLKSNGVHVWPLPSNWDKPDVMMIAAPYGQVTGIVMESLPNNQKGALIDYNKDANAKSALAGLNGLALMGTQLRCEMQVEPEPVKPIHRFVVCIDELPIKSRPEVEPRLDDCEVFLDLPSKVRTEDATKEWLASLKFNTGVDEVVLVKNKDDAATGQAYVRFKSHPEALKALAALTKAGVNGSSPQQASWSESERALRGTRGPYGLDVMRRLRGVDGARLLEICQACGLTSLASAGGDEKPSEGSSAGIKQAHFVVRCEEQAQADKCKEILAADLAKIHEVFTNEVRGSLVLSGFPASWLENSEKGLKFVFAPFGGIAGAVLEEACEAGVSERIAYVKLKNLASIDKALSNLHKTKVGDGDLVEECVVTCHRWHPLAWSDRTCKATFFIDQLPMNRRPLEAAPGPEDRELFVKNLPLQDMNRQQLQEYFEGFGEVEDLHLITDVFTGEPNGEGYVRFKSHDNALRCIEALPAEAEAEESHDLTGWWSESERALQRKSNCYRFNLICELVGKNGTAIERLIAETHVKGFWVLAESLQQKDRYAAPRSGRQMHFVARCTEEAQAAHFRELLGGALEDAHGRISDRIDKRKRKAETAAAVGNKENAAEKETGASMGKPADASAGALQAPWPGAIPGAMPGAMHGYPGGYGGPQGWPPGGAPPPWFAGQPPPGYPPQAGHGPWTQPAAPLGVSVFEQGRQEAPKEKEGRHRSRKRRHRSDRGEAGAEGAAEGEEGKKEKKHRSGGEHSKRRRHRHGGGGGASGSPAKGEAES